MSPLSPSALNTLWLNWKSLKLPWRKKWLAGTDLTGNTFWYFKPGLSTARSRRILEHNPRTYYSDIQISPQWHQWLRYTRSTAPTIVEQQADAVRQRELKCLAQAADQRWAAKPSVLDKPRPGALELGSGGGEAGDTIRLKVEVTRQKGFPLKQKTGNPGEAWHPEPWAPERLKR